MTLTTRVSRFFLVALGLILISNALMFYSLARYFLYREFDQQLEGTLNTLVAAVEVEDDDVKWEPSDHQVTLGSERTADDVRWVVVNERSQIVDQSKNLAETPQDRLIIEAALRSSTADRSSVTPADLRFRQASLAAAHPKPVTERDIREHAALTVMVARSRDSISKTLNLLAGILLGLSLGAWWIAAIGGHWYCRKALEPVSDMARSVRLMGPQNPQQRLPIATSGDELSELGFAFNRLLDQLFEAYQRQQRFAGDAAHQLRTPLTVLQGEIEVTLRRPRQIEEYTKTLNVLKDQVVEVRQMVESLLFLARLEEDAVQPELEVVDLSSWLNTFFQRWISHPRAADLRQEIEPDLRARILSPLLSQLLDNLVQNAFKYSRPETPVTVTLNRRQGNVVLAVIDRGMGISSTDLKLIFDPFFRSENARRSGAAGTGLGLALAARIATTLHGRLECQSVLNEGTELTLILPGCDPV